MTVPTRIMWFSVSDVEAMYQADDCTISQSVNAKGRPQESESNIDALPPARTLPASKGSAKRGLDIAPPREVKYVQELWKEREEKYRTIDEEEDEERLRLLYQIVHDIYEQFGAKWSNRVCKKGTANS